MAAFDPDAYLAQPVQPLPPFDPDAYLGLSTQPQPQPEPEQSVFREIADVPLKIAGGVATGIRLITDTLGADNPVSQRIRGVEDWIGELYSAQSKKDSAEISRIMKEAEDKGVADQVLAGLKAFSVAPIDLVTNALGTSAPVILAGLVGGAPTAAARVGMASVGAAMGAGTIKSAIYDATKETLSQQTNMSPEQIEAAAVKAQEYGGENLDQILLGAGLVALGSVTGAEKSVAKILSEKILKKAAVTESASVATKKLAERGIISQAGRVGGAEFLGEALEGGQEQLAANLALQRQGFDVPTMRGVLGQATLEGMAGFGMGAPSGIREVTGARREVAREQELEALKAAESQKPAEDTEAPPPPAAPDEGLTEEESAAFRPAEFGGKPIVEGAVIPEATKPTVTPDTEAQDYLAAIDSGEKKPNASILKKLVSNLGIDVEPGTGYTQRAQEALRQHLTAKQGAPSVTETDTTTTGARVGVAGQSQSQGAAPVTTTTVDDGVATTGTDTEGATTGAAGVTPTLTPEIQAADDLLKSIDAGGVPLSTAKINSIARNIGLEVSKKASPEETISRLRAAVDRAKSTAEPVAAQQTAKPTEVLEDVPDLKTEAKEAEPIDAQEFLLIDELRLADEEGRSKFVINGKLKKLNDFQRANNLPVTNPLGGSTLSARLKPGEAKAARYTKENLPPDTEVLYDRARTELNTLTEAANAYRENLVKGVEDAQAELDRITDRIDDYELKAEPEAKETEGYKTGYEFLKQKADAAAAALEEAENKLEEHGPVQNKVDPWNKLDAADKDVLFNNVVYGNVHEFRKGVKALRDYQTKRGIEKREAGLKERSKEELEQEAGEKRLANAYEENRNEAGKLLGVRLPMWSRLSEKGKALFRQANTSTREKTGKTIYSITGKQQDAGFESVARYVTEEKIRIGTLTPEKLEAQRKATEKRRAEEEKSRKELEKLQKAYDRIVERTQGLKSASLSDSIVEELRAGRIDLALDKFIAVLEGKRQRLASGKLNPTENIQLQVAKTLRKLKLNTTLSVADSLPDGDLGQYSAFNNHIVLSMEGGLTPNVLLHELVHAATVQVMERYLSKKFNLLTKQQIQGAEQIIKLMKSAHRVLVKQYPNAFENVYEFISYSITDKDFAEALHSLDTGKKSSVFYIPKESDLKTELGERPLETMATFNMKPTYLSLGSILPSARTAWSEFKQAIANVLGISKGAMKSVNFLMEMHAAFEDILSVPEGPIYVNRKLSAKTPLKAEEAEEKLHDTGGLDPTNAKYKSDKLNQPSSFRRLFNRLTTLEGWRKNVTDLADKSYLMRRLQNMLDKAGKTVYDMYGKFTNFATQADLAMAKGRNYVTNYLQVPVEELKAVINDYAIKNKVSIEDYLLPLIQQIGEMKHEPERRLVKFITSVPLSTTKNLTQNGKPISAADRRIQILGDTSMGVEGLIHRVKLTKDQAKKLKEELEFLAKNYADPDGYGSKLTSDIKDAWSKLDAKTLSAQKASMVDINSVNYNVLGISPDEVKKREKDFKEKFTEEQQNDINNILDKARTVSDVQRELDTIGNYWSRPVDNLVSIYDYEYYMPYKGFAKEVDRDGNPDALGAEQQDMAFTADGRFSVSENPVLQLISDAYRAAGRAGRKDFSQAIKNAVEAGLIPTARIVKRFSFIERQNAEEQIAKFKGAKGKSIFHYNADGSLEIIQIDDRALLESMRPSFKNTGFLTDIANTVTGFIGQGHTRYNYNFAPLNFVRDTLTNAWNIGASGDLGPAEAVRYLTAISAEVTKVGLAKAWRVAELHELGTDAAKAKIKNMIEEDPFVRDMFELIEHGGKTTYLEGFSTKSSLEKLNSDINSNNLKRALKATNKFVDNWNYAFEFTSRAAAYRIKKSSLYNKFIKDGMTPAKAKAAAIEEAAAWTKNLANFEKSGTWGRQIGGVFMFWRPAVTGALRAAEAALPAFMSKETYEKTLPDVIKNDAVAKEKAIKAFLADKKNARIMLATLAGVGYTAYMMATLMSPDDDWGRNTTKTDNMQQWTRYARFHIPGTDTIIQIPWGFGLGSFAASGAQFASWVHGNQSGPDLVSNVLFSIMTDAFLPLPISRMSAVDSPVAWLVDTVTPTAARPLVEHLMNKDGLGRTINSAAQRRMGEAYTGGDKVNELYKDASQYLYRATKGGIDLSPNTMYFFANSYIDGISKMAELFTSTSLLALGDKNFVAKTDVPLLGSFIGAKTNVDSREYGQMEQKIKNIDRRLETMERVAPDKYAEYVSENPEYLAIVDIYRSGQGELNEIRKEMNQIRLMDLSPKNRNEILDALQFQQNAIKYGMNVQFKVLGMKP